MAHVLALQGPSNSGKTETLIRLCHDLRAKYPDATFESLLKSEGRDIKVILRGVRGKTIGIESRGDPNSRLEESLADFVARKCDIIFCACRTSGMTVDWVNALSPRHRVQFVPKARANRDPAAANARTAASLMELAGL